MHLDQIVAECVARKKLDPAKTTKQITDSVLDDVAAFKAELSKRLEFSTPGPVVNDETRAADPAQSVLSL